MCYGYSRLYHKHYRLCNRTYSLLTISPVVLMLAVDSDSQHIPDGNRCNNIMRSAMLLFFIVIKSGFAIL